MSNYFSNASFQLPFKITPKLIALVLVVVVLLAAGFTSVFVVDQTEEAVVTTFGRYNRVVGAGLHFKMPFGIEQNYNVPTQVTQNMSFGFRSEAGTFGNVDSKQSYPSESVMLTGDLNIIDVQWIIQFNIEDPVKWLFQVESRAKTIRDISQSIINELIGDRTIFDVLGPARTAIESEAVTLMNSLFSSYNIGVRVSAVKLQNVVPPSGKVSEAFEDVNRAQQDMNRLINEGKQRFNAEIPRARGEAQQLIQQAEGYATERTNRAEGDVARFLSVLQQYRQDPQNTRIRLYNEMVEEVFAADSAGQKPTLIDKKLDNVVPFLNTMKQSSQPGGAQ